MVDSHSKTITIMGTAGVCSGKYRSGKRKGQPCTEGGAIRLDKIIFCGLHAKSELRDIEAFYGLSIDEIKELAVDKHLACMICNRRYHSKEVNP